MRLKTTKMSQNRRKSSKKFCWFVQNCNPDTGCVGTADEGFRIIAQLFSTFFFGWCFSPQSSGVEDQLWIVVDDRTTVIDGISRDLPLFCTGQFAM